MALPMPRFCLDDQRICCSCWVIPMRAHGTSDYDMSSHRH